MDDAILDFLRTRSGFRIELDGDLMGGVRSTGEGDRGGNSYMASSFSNMVGDGRSRTTAGWAGWIPCFSGRCVYWVGRRHDSNSASSRGVTARSENPRTLFLDRFKQKRTPTVTALRTRVPRTAPRMIQTLDSCSMVSRAGGSVGVHQREKGCRRE